MVLYRGETFRRENYKVHSLIPSDVRVLALTAIATVITRKKICNILGMTSPAVVVESPNKPNITYAVQQNPGTLEETFAPLVEDIKRFRHNTDRTIVFCRTYDACGQLYLFFKCRLGREFTEPVGAPDVAKFKIVDMFSACTHPRVKDSILQSFVSSDSYLRVVIATVAFGMGLDCPNIQRVYHWGPPEDVELYLQETGCAGRDGKPARAVLYHGGKGFIARHIAENMKEYCTNKERCRREMLLKHFDGTLGKDCNLSLCKCCDVCERICKCTQCS